MERQIRSLQRFADVESIDLKSTPKMSMIHQLRALSRPLFRRINLEDIKAPECFIIESRLRETDGYSGLP